jgi:hypothetical protein
MRLDVPHSIQGINRVNTKSAVETVPQLFREKEKKTTGLMYAEQSAMYLVSHLRTIDL